MQIELDRTLEVLQHNQEAYERYCHFRDQRLSGQCEAHQKTCQFCPLTDHSILACPFYHFIPNRSIVIAKYMIERKAARPKPNLDRKRKYRPRINNLKATIELPRVTQAQKRQSDRNQLFRPSFTTFADYHSIIE